MLDFLTEAPQHLNVTGWKLLCPGQVLRHSPRKGLSHMTQSALLKQNKKARYEALHERPPSQRLWAGAINPLFSLGCRSLGGYCPDLINLSQTFCVQSCERQELCTATKYKYVSFGGSVTSLAVQPADCNALIPSELRYLASRALCGAHHQRHASRYPSVGAVLSTTLVQTYHTSRRCCLLLLAESASSNSVRRES